MGTRDSGDRSHLSSWGRGGILKLDSSTLSSAVSGRGRDTEGSWELQGRHSLLRGALRLCQREAAPTNDFWPSVECSGMIAFGEHTPRNYIK